jgi:uncharacterized protein (DUF4415 family)
MSDVRTYTRSQLRRMKDRTDWDRVADTTDADIKRSIAEDPDWAEFRAVDWSKADLVVPPRKKPISIRLDEDVLDFFREQGAGYQRRINAVLRAYMTQVRRKAPSPGRRRKAG